MENYDYEYLDGTGILGSITICIAWPDGERPPGYTRTWPRHLFVHARPERKNHIGPSHRQVLDHVHYDHDMDNQDYGLQKNVAFYKQCWQNSQKTDMNP